MLKELTDFYTPEKILHRDKQIKIIKNVFETFKKYSHATNLLVLGVTGSGKTTVINKIMEDDADNNYFFTSASITKTSFKTLKALFDLNFNTSDKLLTEAIKLLKKQPKIIIIDEINRIKDLNVLFNDLNTIYRETGCPFILVSNKRTLIDNMPEDAKKTLFFEKVDFPSYNALELYNILEDRLRKIQNAIPRISEGNLRFICGIGAREGSARVVISITLKCILADNFTQANINKIWKDMEKEDWKDFLESLNGTEKRFLKVILDLYASEKNISNSDILKEMSELTPSRISQLITSFSDYGIIKAEYKNLGRKGGRVRVLGFASKEIYNKLDKLVV